jgi:hypothetical protein
MAMPIELETAQCYFFQDVVPTTRMEGESNEPFPEVITYNLALSVPHNLGTKIPISDFERSNSGGGIGVYPELYGPSGRRGTGIERTERPCAPSGNGAAESVDIEICRDNKRSDSHSDTEPESEAQEEAVLG